MEILGMRKGCEVWGIWGRGKEEKYKRSRDLDRTWGIEDNFFNFRVFLIFIFFVVILFVFNYLESGLIVYYKGEILINCILDFIRL